MLAAFQGFAAPYGGKKTGAGWKMFSFPGIIVTKGPFSSTNDMK